MGGRVGKPDRMRATPTFFDEACLVGALYGGPVPLPRGMADNGWLSWSKDGGTRRARSTPPSRVARSFSPVAARSGSRTLLAFIRDYPGRGVPWGDAPSFVLSAIVGDRARIVARWWFPPRLRQRSARGQLGIIRVKRYE